MARAAGGFARPALCSLADPNGFHSRCTPALIPPPYPRRFAIPDRGRRTKVAAKASPQANGTRRRLAHEFAKDKIIQLNQLDIPSNWFQVGCMQLRSGRHSTNCTKFGHFLLKMMTRGKRSVSVCNRLADDASLVVQVSGGILWRPQAAPPRLTSKDRNNGDNKGRHKCSAGLRALLFFANLYYLFS